MSKKKVIGVAVPILVIAFVGFGLWLARRPVPDMVQGMADADSINVAAKISARVAKLNVREGDTVVAHQVLFELDSPEVAAKQRQVNAQLDSVRAVEAKTEEGARQEEIEAAEANWRRSVAATELAQSTYKRINTLFNQGVVTRQRFEESAMQARSTAQAEAAARAAYDQALSGARNQDKQAARADVRRVEGAVAEVEASHDEILGRAPSAGEISKRLADVGELVPAGYPVFTIVDLTQPWVALYLREDQFGDVAIGRVVRGEIPALRMKGVPFKVYFINPAGDFATWRATRQSSGYDVKSFEVRVRPLQNIDGLRPGMSVLFPWPQS
jgi:HlyD family secretion protein